MLAGLLGVLITWVAAKRAVNQPVGTLPEYEEKFLHCLFYVPEFFEGKSQKSINRILGSLSKRKYKELFTILYNTYSPHLDGFLYQDRLRDQQISPEFFYMFSQKPLTTSLKELNLVVKEFQLITDAIVAYGGTNPPVLNAQGEYVRVFRKPSTRALLLGGVAGLFLGWLITALALVSPLQISVLILIAFGGLLLSLVDIETMFIDIPSLRFISALSGVGAALYLIKVINSEFARFAIGLELGVLVGITLLIKGTLFAFKKLRGLDGLGGGDLKLLFLTLWLPVLLSGDLLVGIGGVAIASILAMSVKVVTTLVKKSQLSSPTAFAPFLCSGWLIAWALINTFQIGAGGMY